MLEAAIGRRMVDFIPYSSELDPVFLIRTRRQPVEHIRARVNRCHAVPRRAFKYIEAPTTIYNLSIIHKIPYTVPGFPRTIREARLSP